MKKLLGILVLGLLLSLNFINKAQASNHWTWSISDDSYEFLTIEYYNSLNHSVKIKGINIKNSSGATRYYKLRTPLIVGAQTDGKTTQSFPSLPGFAGSEAQAWLSVDLNYGKPSASNKSLKDLNKPSKKEKGWFRWWYIPLGIVALIILGVIGDATSGESKKTKKSSFQGIDKKNPPTISEQALINFISKVWSGRETLPITFWLCFFAINGIISFGAGYLAVSNDNNIFTLAAVASNIWAGVGVWNSSTNYQLKKIKEKQPHGWAYAAKVAVVLNFIIIISQAGLLLSAS